MKRILLSLLLFVSLCANAQNWKSHPKKPYSSTDSCLVFQDSTKKFYRIKCSEIGGGGSSIDTTKVGRIEQGRGTAPIFMYFNGVAWVRNDTSYVAQTGTNKFSGDFLSNQSFFTFGLNSTNNHIIYSDQNYGRMISENSSSGIQSSVGAFSSSAGSIQLVVTNPTPAYSRQFVINGSSSATPNLAYMFDKGIAYYNGDYSAEMEASQNLIPSLKKVKQLISDSLSSGGGGSTNASNGLSLAGDTVKLGGTLNDTTIINTNNNTLTLAALSTDANKVVLRVTSDGYSILDVNNLGADNISLGLDAGISKVSGSNSLILGRGAAPFATTISYATVIGQYAANTCSSITESVVIGTSSGVGNVSESTITGFSAGIVDNSVVSTTNLYGAGAGYSSKGFYDCNIMGYYGAAGLSNAVSLRNSILIGNNTAENDNVNTTTGGIIHIGNYTHTGGFNNTIAIGDSATNTKTNQVVFAPKYRHLRLRGVDYELPATQGAADTYLKNNGSGVLSWANVSGGMSNALTEGAIWVGGTDDTAVARIPSGDWTINNLGVATISNNAVTNAKILDETINLSTKVTNRLDTANMVLVGQNQSYFGGKYYALKDSITNTSPSVRNMIDSDLPSRSRNKFKLFGNMNVYGTSIEVGASAESGTTTEGGYLYLIANNLGLKLNNYASGGNGIYVSAISAFTTIPTLDNYSSLYIGGQLNDARKGTDRVNVNPAISKKIVAGYNSIMASHFARLQVPVSSGSITKGGSWSNFTTITTRSSGALSGNAMFATSSGATLTYTSPVTSNLIIGCFGTDGVIKSYGRFTISVDGVVVATYVSNGVADGRADFAGNDNSIIPDAVVIQNLQNKAHTVVITTLDNLTTPVDYIGTLNYPNSCQPVVLSSIMKLTDIGYAKATSEIPPKNFGSDRIFNQIDSAIQQNINSDSWYNYPITFWNCNIDFNPYTGTSTDSIHPTYSVGYPALAKGFLKNAIQPSADVKNQQLYTNTAGTATNFFGWSSDDNFSFNLNRQLGTAIAPNTSRPQAAIVGAIASGASNWSFHTSPANNSGVTEAMRIDGSQNVGIGTSSPTVKLQVSADIMMGNKYIISDDYTSTTALINNTSGEAHSLRILTKDKDGTDNVQLTLEAVGDPLAANREFFAFAYNAGSQDYQLFTTATGTGTIRPFRMGVGSGPTAIYVNASSNVGFGTTTPQSKVDIEGGVAVGSTYAGTNAAPTDGAIIQGNVGIGTATPDVPLVVSNSSSAAFVGIARFLAPNNTISGNASSITIGVGTTTNNAGQLRFHYDGAGSASNRLDFGFSGSINAALSILASGNVGIGITNPTNKLEVDGLVKPKVYTVSTLPTCNVSTANTYATVTDALTPTYLTPVVGGGAIAAPVFCNSSQWVTH